MGSSTYLFGTWTRLVSISFVGIGVLVDLQSGVSVKLQHCAEEKICFIAWCLMPGWQWVEYASTSATRHVGISGWQAWVCRYIWNWACRHISSLKLKDMRRAAMPNTPQARHAYFQAPSLITANLQQTFAYLAEDKFAHCCLNTSISRLRFISQCTRQQMFAPLLNYHQDHCHHHCHFHVGQLPMHCNAWICNGICNAAYLMQAAQDHCFILHFSSVFCSINYVMY